MIDDLNKNALVLITGISSWVLFSDVIVDLLGDYSTGSKVMMAGGLFLLTYVMANKYDGDT